MAKRKKLWIILAVVCACIFTLGMVFGLAFRFKKLDIEFLSRAQDSRLPVGIIEEIKSEIEYPYGKNLLFLNMDSTVDEIEKQYPFVKVNSVRRYFPNIVRIFISERIPEFRVQDSEDATIWYIVDNEFKVLDVMDATEGLTSNEYYEKTTEIDPKTMTFESDTKPGEFIGISNDYPKYLSEISDGIYGKNLSSTAAHSISITSSNGKLSFVITMRNATAADRRGCRILIDGTEDLKIRVFAGVSAFESETQKDADLNVYENVIKITKNPVTGNYEGLKPKPEEQG